MRQDSLSHTTIIGSGHLHQDGLHAMLPLVPTYTDFHLAREADTPADTEFDTHTLPVGVVEDDIPGVVDAEAAVGVVDTEVADTAVKQVEAKTHKVEMEEGHTTGIGLEVEVNDVKTVEGRDNKTMRIVLQEVVEDKAKGSKECPWTEAQGKIHTVEMAVVEGVQAERRTP